jgi:hypothetical protein
MRPSTAAAESWPRWCPTSTAGAWSRCSTDAATSASSAISGASATRRAARSKVVSIDPYEPYRHAIQAELPGARIVCDPFHLVRGANTARDAVRRERQRENRLCELFAATPRSGCARRSSTRSSMEQPTPRRDSTEPAPWNPGQTSGSVEPRADLRLPQTRGGSVWPFSPARRRAARRARRSGLRVRGRSRGGRCSRSRRSPRPLPSRPLGRGRRRHARRRP